MKSTILYVFLLLVFSSCTKFIDIDLNDDEAKKIVVDASFSTYAQEHEVKLSISANYFSADAPTLISGATVTISDGVNSYQYFEVSPGVYKTLPNVRAIAEKNYTLTIDYDGKTYTSENYCDSVPTLDSVVIQPIFETQGSPTPDYHKIRISTQEKIGFGDYYAWKIYVNGVLRNDTISEQISSDDRFFPDGTYFNLIELISYDDLNSGDVIEVAQFCISKFTYDAFFAILLQTDFRGGIFDTPPADVPTNMNEGAVGIFTVSGESRKTAIVP